MYQADPLEPDTTQSTPDFATIVRRHQAGVYRYLRVLGADETSVADLTQETLLLLLEKPFTWQSDFQTSAWLRRAARNLFLNHCRKQGRVILHEDLDRLESAWAAMIQDNEGEEILWALRACMAKLAPRAQEGLRLRYGENLKRAEIGSALNMSQDGVKSLLQRARAWLKQCIEGRTSHDEWQEG